MDETKDTKGLSSVKPGQASKETDGITSKETEPQTYTQDQVTQRVSDALSAAGRDAQSLATREATVKAQEDANKAKQAAADAAELAEAQSDPDKWAAYQKEQPARQRIASIAAREAAVTKSEADNAAKIQAAEDTQRGNLILEVASAKKVDAARLKTLSTKFNIEGKEKLEELADEIIAGNPQDPKRDPDSGVTVGGHKDLSGKSPMELATEAYSEEKK